MELLLIRHALPVRRELIDGAADPELSDVGAAQTALLARYLASEPLDAVYTSPLRRAVQTASPVASAHGLEPVVVEGLAESDRDASEYVPVEELKAADDPRWHSLVRGEWLAEETPEQFAKRVVDALEQLIPKHRGQRIAAVCHGGVINRYLAHVLGLPAAGVGFFYPNYTSIHRVAAASSGERSVVTVNETTHLRGTGLPMGLFQKG